MSDWKRRVFRADGVMVGTVERVTGAERQAHSYEPVDTLPAVIYVVSNKPGDGGVFDSYSDAREALIYWSSAYRDWQLR